MCQKINQIFSNPIIFITINIISSIFLMIVGGIIGNRSDAGFLLYWPNIYRILSDYRFIWGIVYLTLGLPLIICIIYYRQANVYLSELNNLDDKFLLLIPQLHVTTQSIALDRLIDAYLSNAFRIFGKKHNLEECFALIYCPDSNNSTLIPKHFLNAPSDYRNPNFSCRILSTPKKGQIRGLEAEVFLSDSCDPQIIKIKQKKDKVHGTIEITEPSGLHILDYKPPHPTPYRTVVMLRIADDTQTWGTLCFYSMRKDIFDNKAIRGLLIQLAGRLAVAFQISESLP